jgi:hypothetical protein
MSNWFFFLPLYPIFLVVIEIDLDIIYRIKLEKRNKLNISHRFAFLKKKFENILVL